MPEQETIKQAEEDAREGKSPSTQAGEFVREEIHHVRGGKHGARSPHRYWIIQSAASWGKASYAKGLGFSTPKSGSRWGGGYTQAA